MKKWQNKAKQRAEFKNRLRNEYLGSLQSRCKSIKPHSIKFGDSVPIVSDNANQPDWPLGKQFNLNS